MGRSGTSATARLLQAAGLDVGRELMEATPDNPLGFFEDLRFFELDRDLVKAGLSGGPDQRPRWAFADGIDPARLDPFRAPARALLDERAAAACRGGSRTRGR